VTKKASILYASLFEEVYEEEVELQDSALTIYYLDQEESSTTTSHNWQSNRGFIQGDELTIYGEPIHILKSFKGEYWRAKMPKKQSVGVYF